MNTTTDVLFNKLKNMSLEEQAKFLRTGRTTISQIVEKIKITNDKSEKCRLAFEAWNYSIALRTMLEVIPTYVFPGNDQEDLIKGYKADEDYVFSLYRLYL